MRQAEHLHEIRHRAFAAVILPVGIGDETDGRIERQIRGDGRLFGRVERQSTLRAHQHVENEQPTGMKQQHADRVGDRMLLAPLIDAGELVDRDFDRPQYWRQERAFAAEHARHISAEHRRHRNDNHAVEQEFGSSR